MPQKRRRLSSLMALLASLSLVTPFPLIERASAATTTQWTTEADFGLGTLSNTSETQFPGEVTLKNQIGEYTDTTYEDFRAGNNTYNGINMTAVTEEGSVEINQGWVYNMGTTPGLENNSVEHVFFDSAHNLLYVSQWEGGSFCHQYPRNV